MISNDEIKKEIAFEESEIFKDKITTAVKKAQFVNEIKNGLGEKIKNNPRTVTILKKPWYHRLKDTFKTLFTKF